jgi:hypothetical protein
MSKQLNFELFNYLNEVQSEIQSAVCNSLEVMGDENEDDEVYCLGDEERKLYQAVAGVLEFYIRKIDTLYLPKKVSDSSKPHKGAIMIKDSDMSFDYKYEVEFSSLDDKIMIPCWDEEGVRQTISQLKKEHKDCDITVYNERKKVKKPKTIKRYDELSVKSLRKIVDDAEDRLEQLRILKSDEDEIKRVELNIDYFNDIINRKIEAGE